MTDLDKELARVGLQEQRLRFRRFDRAAAWELGACIKRQCEARGQAVAIEIRIARDTVFYYSMPGTTPNNAEWLRRKRNTVELMQSSSYHVGLSLNKDGMTLQEKCGASLAEYAVHGGCFPIFVDGVGCVGAVGVSGLPHRADHELLVEALCAAIGVPYEDAGPGPARD